MGWGMHVGVVARWTGVTEHELELCLAAGPGDFPVIPLEGHHGKAFQHRWPHDFRRQLPHCPLQRGDWQEIGRLIAAKRYFVLHAPRQTG